ncbi:MAG TPA: prolyl oligopeptidase family serine peptidase [Chthonomonadaceae bacterium]|nr:prolyl oligopeptidase family serine peptidase [Chthonomonadaceae bacterium]
MAHHLRKRFDRIGLFALSVTVAAIATAGCDSLKPPHERFATLVEARRGFKTSLRPQAGDRQPVDNPPPSVFRLVQYPAQPGSLQAYLTPDPRDGRRHPAIVWITGGDCNSIGEMWNPRPRSNDQTAAQYREAGIVLMVASLRGGNDNPGKKEGFLGEVDDVLAARDFLAQQPYVDPDRIYLGGHSTGGTLAMLVAECSDKFRAVFAFGPVYDVAGYGDNSPFTPFDTHDAREDELRSPGYWLKCIKSPTWAIEGAAGDSNIHDLRKMNDVTTNANVHFLEVRDADHFADLAPTNAYIAQAILADTGPTCTIQLPQDRVNDAFDRLR